MMLEEQLKKRMFLNKAGAFSIKKNTRSIIETLEYTAGLLQNPQNMVAVYPQGEIASLYHYPVKFEKGILHVLKKTKAIQIIFYAALIDYFSKRKPDLNFYLEEFHFHPGISVTEIEDAFNAHLLNSIQSQKPPEV